MIVLSPVRIEGDDPETVNAAVRAALAGGATGVVLSGGVLSDSDPLGRALAGVALDQVAVGLDAAFDGPDAANALAVVAKGTPRARLMFHMDPIGALAAAGASPLPVSMHLAQAAATAERHAGAYPDATFFLASGRPVGEARGSPARALGFAAACAAACVRASLEAGLPAGRALDGMVLDLPDGVSPGAARRVWIALASSFGGDTPVRIETRAPLPRIIIDAADAELAEAAWAAFERIEREGGALAWLAAADLRR
jgi:methylmalonyl-CoA mutase